MRTKIKRGYVHDPASPAYYAGHDEATAEKTKPEMIRDSDHSRYVVVDELQVGLTTNKVGMRSGD